MLLTFFRLGFADLKMAVIQIVRVEYRSGPKADLEAAMKSIVATTQVT